MAGRPWRLWITTPAMWGFEVETAFGSAEAARVRGIALLTDSGPVRSVAAAMVENRHTEAVAWRGVRSGFDAPWSFRSMSGKWLPYEVVGAQGVIEEVIGE